MMTVYRHASFPNWGRGVILEEREGKLYMRFEHAGEKAFSSAPKFRSMLVPIDLAPEEVQGVMDRLSVESLTDAARSRDIDAIWRRIVREIPQNEPLQNWSARGYTGRSFRIVDADNEKVTVFGGEMTAERNISKTEFEKVLHAWDDYVRGDVGRAEMTDLSQNTTYIFSILHRVIG